MKKILDSIRGLAKKRARRREDDMGEMRVASLSAGDVKHQWNSENEFEVGLAKEVFDKCKSKGYFIYKMKKPGDTQGARMTEFDPDAEYIIASPQIKGG